MKRVGATACGILCFLGSLAAQPAGVVARDAASHDTRKRVIVLGFDGMDHAVTERLMGAGRMPHFTRLAHTGTFEPLQTSIPPQSPVAWSNFITGRDSGGHGIFDFIHRNPDTMLPYLSTSRTTPPERVLKLGNWQLPLTAGSTELLRRGAAFWEVLTRNGIETTIIRMPANFPPSGTATREISGMGTPDLLGTYGTFSFYTTDTTRFEDPDVGGGRIYAVHLEKNVLAATLQGPPNPYRVDGEALAAAFSLYVDPEADAAKLVVGDIERLVQVGEWTDWVPVRFRLFPTRSLHGMCRFYLKSLRPVLELYATPLNFDPIDPAMPISTPPSFAHDLAQQGGRFYTQGMPEDTKALSEGVLTPDEFLVQARIAGDENVRQFQQVLAAFDTGLLFYYFGNVDQTSHMMWRALDPGHPAYDADHDPQYADVVYELYEQMDDVLGLAMQQLDPGTTLIAMSDHGFASWRRAFHLNAWLREQGYLTTRGPTTDRDAGPFANVDWRRTRAYGLGLNGLYINVRGRERFGIVDPSERESLMREIAQKLEQTIDPATGQAAVTRVYFPEATYADRGFLADGPDLIVGYARGTRCSNASARGAVPSEVFADNDDAWSGDHCMDHEAVPGILLTNRALRQPLRKLEDLAGAILAEFGFEAGDLERQARER